ncbi:MAG: phage head closure protein [Defluviitaleaceae bacterium]|nr:phage head closure protein [Defluviitaleaceae bacterium]
MPWSDEITLIHADFNNALDDDGFSAPRLGGHITIYASKKSVGFNEFFKAKQAGYTEQMKFDVYTAEYEGQTIAEYDGKLYRILRTYIDPKTSGEYTELTLSDLKEKGAAR